MTRRSAVINSSPSRSKRKTLRTSKIDSVALQKGLGLYPEASEILKNRYIGLGTSKWLRRMTLRRQIEVASVMLTTNVFTEVFVRALYYASATDEIVGPTPGGSKAIIDKERAFICREVAKLDQRFKFAERRYNSDQLDLVVGRGYLRRLLRSAPIVRFLAHYHPDVLAEFERTAELSRTR